jgi:Ca2+-binding EF-hand superfamily protein
MLESMVEDLHANDKDGSGDISQKEFKKIIRRSSARIHHVFLFAVDLLTHFDGDGVR